MKLEYSKLQPAFAYLKDFPKAKLAVVAGKFNLTLTDLAEGIAHYFGQPHDIPDAYAEVTAIHASADPILAATERSVRRAEAKQAQAPAPTQTHGTKNLVRRVSSTAAEAELPADLMTLSAGRGGVVTGYDAIYRSDGSKPQIIFTTEAANRMLILQDPRIVMLSIDFQYSPSTKIVVIRKNSVGQLRLRKYKGRWSLSCNRFRTVDLPKKYLLKVAANRVDFVMLTPVDVTELAEQ